MSAIAVLAVFITARSLEDETDPSRSTTQSVATDSPADQAPSTTAAPSSSTAPTQQPTPTPLEPDPTVVSEGVLTFVGPDGSLRLLAPDGGEAIIAKDVLHPAVHPDRDAVAFVRYDGTQSEIWIWELDGGLEMLGSREGLVRNLEWNSDGDSLLYHVQDDGDTTTVIRRYDFFWGEADTLLASDEFSLEDASIQGFDVFPNGDLAVQVNEDGGSCEIFVVDADLTYAETLTGGIDQGCQSHPSVSPDGEQVAFIAQTEDGEAFVAVVDTDGGNYRELAAVTTPGGGDAFWPRIAWSPDSEVVLFETLDDGEAVYAQEAGDTTGDTRRLVARGHHPAWQ